MAKKKKGGGKQSPKLPSREPFLLNLKKVAGGLLFLIVLVIAAGLLAPHIIVKKKVLLPKHQKQYAVSPVKKVEIPKPIEIPDEPKIVQQPKFEVFPKEEFQPIPKIIPEIKTSKKTPHIVIILDDLGYDNKMAENFLNMGLNLTFSIFPHSPFQKFIAQTAQKNGYEVMLHLPMEPIEYPQVDPGPGALLTHMTPDQLTFQLEKDLNEVPYIKGVNNHMGSKMTSSSTQMYQILSVLKKRGLFFIDSKTNSNAVCGPSARLFKLPFAQRDVFIDHVIEQDSMRKQIKRLIHIAVKNGEAIGICHPHEITYQILNEMRDEIKSKVKVVKASEIVRIQK